MTVARSLGMNHLLIPLGLSEHHDDLIEALAKLRWGPSAILLHVIEEIRGVPDAELEDFYRSLEARAQQNLEAVAKRLANLGIDCELDIRRGRRGETIVQVAAERGAEIIVLTSRPARRGPLGLRAGSTSHQVALFAPCSVFLLRHATDEPDGAETLLLAPGEGDAGTA